MREEGIRYQKRQKSNKKDGISLDDLNIVATIENPERSRDLSKAVLALRSFQDLRAADEIQSGEVLEFRFHRLAAVET